MKDPTTSFNHTNQRPNTSSPKANLQINIYMDDVRVGPHNNGKMSGWNKWIIVRNIETVMHFLSLGVVNNLSLDHDMGCEQTGYDLVKWMAEYNHWPNGKINVHSANPIGRDNMIATINRYNSQGHTATSEQL